MLSVERVSARNVLLGLVAAAVLIAGVYLFIEVRSTTTAIAASPSPRTPEAAQASAGRAPPAVREDHVAGTGVSAPPAPTIASDEESSDETAAALDRPNPKIDAIMDQANKHYDKGEWE